jgi:hypothetical protein
LPTPRACRSYRNGIVALGRASLDPGVDFLLDPSDRVLTRTEALRKSAGVFEPLQLSTGILNTLLAQSAEIQDTHGTDSTLLTDEMLREDHRRFGSSLSNGYAQLFAQLRKEICKGRIKGAWMCKGRIAQRAPRCAKGA